MPKESIADFDRALALKKDYTQALKNRALARYQLKEYSAVIPDLSIVVSRGEAGADEFAALGVSKYYTKDFQGAIPDLTKAIDGNSKDNEIFVARGGSLF